MSLVRRNIRIRNRMLPGKSSKNSRGSSHSPSSQPTSSAYTTSSGTYPSSMSFDSIEIDPKEQARISVSPTLSDLSGFLPTPCHSYENMAPATTLGPNSCCYAGTGGDMYGWDAELERRNHHEEEYDTIHMSYRRANGARGNLLERVFNTRSA